MDQIYGKRSALPVMGFSGDTADVAADGGDTISGGAQDDVKVASVSEGKDTPLQDIQ